MKQIHFSVYYCSMIGSEKNIFPDKIKIWSPLKILRKTVTADSEQTVQISSLIGLFKQDPEVAALLGDFALDRFSLETLYVETDSAFLGFQEDKTVAQLCSELSMDEPKLAYIFVPGGASISCQGYKFVIHSDEQVHRGTPHVHVKKNGISVRYYLDTLERFPGDALGPEHRRDERRKILPALRRLQPQLQEMWDLNIKGYRTPELGESGEQYYPES